MLSTGTSDREEAERIMGAMMAMDHPSTGRIRWSREALEMLSGSRSRRQKILLADRAQEILGAEPERFAWILAPRPKFTLLSELGRCSNRGMKEAADHICQAKLKTLPAVRFVIDFRGKTRKRPQPGWVAVSAVRNQFPELSDSQIADHLEQAAKFLRDWQSMTEAA